MGEGGTMTVFAAVTKCSTVSSGLRLFLDHISISTQNNSTISFLPEHKITFITEKSGVYPGDHIVVRGKFRPFVQASNPGEFDQKNWYFSQDTICQIEDPVLLEHTPGNGGIQGWLCRLQRALIRSYQKILGEKAAAIITAISLGEKGLMDTEWKTIYQEGGIAHIIAISGLHISLVGMSLYKLLRRLGMPFSLSSVFSGVAVALYVQMTGAGISSVRALLMFLVWLGAQVCGRKYDMLTSAVLAAVVMILPDCRILEESSLWLSFSAIFSLAVLVPCIQDTVRAEPSDRNLRTAQPIKKIYRLLGRTADRIAGSNAWTSALGVWIGMLPVTLYFFYQVVPWSILVNLAVLPLMSAVMGFGLFSAFAGMIYPALGIFLAAPVQYLLEFFELLCRLEQRLPAAVWIGGRPAMWQCVVYYSLLALLCRVLSCRSEADMLGNLAGGRREKVRRFSFLRTRKHAAASAKNSTCRIARAAWAAFFFSGFLLLGSRFPGNAPLLGRFLITVQDRLVGQLSGGLSGKKTEILCLDVGQGDCSLVRMPDGTNCLIDGGSSSRKGIWTYCIGQTVKYYGIQTLDYVFLSHGDSDHTNGITEFLADYETGFAGKNIHGITIKHLILPPTAQAEDFAELRQMALEKSITVLEMDRGDSIKGAQWEILSLAPDRISLTGDKNEDSMVLMLKDRDFRMLFTGDLEGEAEHRLLEAEKTNLLSQAETGEGILQAAVLKVGHHGSKNATAAEFLEVVQPKTAVISCGKDNSYGHPAVETLERLEEAGTETFVTADTGAVRIVTNGEAFFVYIKK